MSTGKKKMTEAERAKHIEKRDAALAEGKIPMTEASELLTNGEIGLIERHYGVNFDPETMSPISMMAGIIWAMERRKPVEKGVKRFDWADVDRMTMRENDAYFAPEPIDLDPDDPESESGKDDLPDA